MRAAVRHAVGTEMDTYQLQEQGESLMARVEEARELYSDLRAQWKNEASKRQ